MFKLRSHARHIYSVLSIFFFPAMLLLTPFKDVVVPPPMAAFKVQMPYAINQVAFSAENSDFAVELSDGRVALLSFGEKGTV